MTSDLKERAKVGRRGVFGTCADRFYRSPLNAKEGPEVDWDGGNAAMGKDPTSPEARSSFKSTSPRMRRERAKEVDVVTLGDISTPVTPAQLVEPSYRSPYRIPRSEHLSFGSGQTRFTEKQDTGHGARSGLVGRKVLMAENMVAAGSLDQLGLWMNTPGLLELFSASELLRLLEQTSRLSSKRSSAWSSALAVVTELHARRWNKVGETLGRATDICENCGAWQRGLDLLKTLQQLRHPTTHAAKSASWRLEEFAGPAGRRPRLEAKGPSLPQVLKQRQMTRLRHTEPNEVSESVEALQRFHLEPRDYVWILEKYSKVFAWEKALALLDDMRVADYHPVVDHYNRALLACERANQWEQVMQIWESLKVSGTPDRMSFSVLLTRSCQLSLWQDALRFWKDMGPDMANEMVCSQIMRACGRAGKWEIALALMDVMQDQEMVLDEVIYGTAIQACERARKWQHALALLVTLLPVERARQEEGPQVDFLGLTEEDWDVIESLEDETSDPRMEFLWDEFKDLYGIEEEEEEVTPDSAVEAVLRTLEVQEPHISPNLPIFSSTVRALSRGFQVARALDILEQMACAGIQRFLATIDDPREIRRGRHGGTIPMERAATIQTTSDTLVLFSRDLMLMSDFATGCADAWHSSLQLLEDVLDKGDLVVDTPLINAVTWAMTCAKCWTRALEMRQVLDNQSLRPSTVTFNTLLTACVQARAAAACQALLQELQRSECLPNQDTEKLIAEIRDQVKIQPLPTSRQKTAMPKSLAKKVKTRTAEANSSGPMLRGSCLPDVFGPVLEGPAPNQYNTIASKRHIQGAASLKDKRKPMLVGSTASSVGPGSYGEHVDTMLLKKTYNVTTQARSIISSNRPE
ncbi:unnamed protein product [Durusdinium trenchii]|uniref:Pentatricopeptide repeat-containing protein, chloroplastic n=1 Tax=Durusdinium trenchii TaxID=1381693 RepID=A0ABP0T2M7_9DINO